MAENKKHHFVPQFYLRLFGDGDSISLFRLESRKHISGAPIKGQSQKPYLYGKDSTVEKSLSNIEGKACAEIGRLVELGEYPDEITERGVALLKFISFQRGRTPSAAAGLEAMMSKTGSAFRKAPGALSGAELDWKEVDVKDPQTYLFGLSSAEEVAPLLADLHKCILINETPIEFITSDAPVVLHNTWCEAVTWRGTNGYGSSGLQLLFPLGPRHLLLMFDPEVYSVGCRKRPTSVTLNNAKDVEALNAMQMSVATQNLYYSGDEATAASIDRLPQKWWVSPADEVNVTRAENEEKDALLVHYYSRSIARLDLSFLRIFKKAKRIQLGTRGAMTRRAAIALYERLNGPRKTRYSAPSESGASERWEIVGKE